MPLTQNAPREPGCAGLGAILVTLPSSMVRNEPHSAEHSQQVLGTISAEWMLMAPRLYARDARASRIYFGRGSGSPRPASISLPRRSARTASHRVRAAL